MSELNSSAGASGTLQRLRSVVGPDRGFGPLPVLIGLALIAIVFQSLNQNFLTPLNLSNMFLQVTATGLIATGAFLVLLLGEVDLSLGSVSGMTAAVMAVLYVSNGTSPLVAAVAGISSGVVVGLLQGLIITRAGVPSFVVTLGGLIGWQGLQLFVLGSTGTLNLPDGPITALTSTFFSPVLGWVLLAVIVMGMSAQVVVQLRRRAALGLEKRSLARSLSPVVLIAVLGTVGILVFSADRGVPLSVFILLAVVAIVDVITQRTRAGQSVYAVGGNADAAKRAGINVDRVKVTIFALSAMFASIGGLLAASRLYAVGYASGGGDVTLNAIAAAVIGGTSLFGGRGRAWSVVLGVLVIGSISNGMDLLGLPSSVRLMITGGVLVVAVMPDSISRRRKRD